VNKALLLLACAVAVVTACNGGSDKPVPEIVVRTPAERGSLLFQDPSVGGPSNPYSCSTCHEPTPGASGEVILSGAPLAGATRRPSYWAGREIEMLRAVNQCLVGFMFGQEHWTAEDPNAQAIYAYLDQLPDDGTGAQPAPFTVVVYPIPDPPAGDDARGAALYARACQACHGALHTGEARLSVIAPVMPEQVLIAHPLPRYTPESQRRVFVEKARSGRFFGQGGQMPPFSLEKLSEQDIGDLLAYIDP
jgi:thiosulfate dehydrogenase